MIKNIINFTEKSYGMFISTDLNTSAISFNKRDGTVIFNEGVCENCYNNFFENISNINRFHIEVDLADETVSNLYIVCNSSGKYYVGSTKVHQDAVDWIDKCNQYINNLKIGEK